MSFPTEWQTVRYFFGTPLKVRFPQSIPANQWIWWGVLTWDNCKRHPQRPFVLRLWTGFWSMVVLLGSEWCHNLAHAAVARAIGKPMDEIHVILGLPRVVYHTLNDTSVTPRQHMLRAAAGPLFNLLALALAWVGRRLTRPDTPARDIANVAAITNAAIAGAGMLPIPGIDGGAMLKWGLVAKGRSIEQADRVVRKTNLGLCGGMAGVCAVATRRRKPLIAVLAGLLAALTLAVGMGWIKE
ncbi:MAG: hypothetical protein JW987_15090 [Anaerolineaceae bacterium]|nr:hypothetical protein [Anaerolineaceae bacterium]